MVNKDALDRLQRKGISPDLISGVSGVVRIEVFSDGDPSWPPQRREMVGRLVANYPKFAESIQGINEALKSYKIFQREMPLSVRAAMMEAMPPTEDPFAQTLLSAVYAHGITGADGQIRLGVDVVGVETEIRQALGVPEEKFREVTLDQVVTNILTGDLEVKPQE